MLRERRIPEKSIEDFVEFQSTRFPGSDKQVLGFIGNVLFHQGEENTEVIRKLFHAGYCYYFALMLKEAFKRGTICFNFSGHVVWLDGTNPSADIAYDIEGVHWDYEHLIPIDKLGHGIYDFLHIPNKQSGMSDEEITNLLDDLKEECRQQD